jgi:hypothetical protein
MIILFIGVGNQRKKTTDLWQISDKLYYLKLYQVHLDTGGNKNKQFY